MSRIAVIASFLFSTAFAGPACPVKCIDDFPACVSNSIVRGIYLTTNVVTSYTALYILAQILKHPGAHAPGKCVSPKGHYDDFCLDGNYTLDVAKLIEKYGVPVLAGPPKDEDYLSTCQMLRTMPTEALQFYSAKRVKIPEVNLLEAIHSKLRPDAFVVAILGDEVKYGVADTVYYISCDQSEKPLRSHAILITEANSSHFVISDPSYSDPLTLSYRDAEKLITSIVVMDNVRPISGRSQKKRSHEAYLKACNDPKHHWMHPPEEPIQDGPLALQREPDSHPSYTCPQ